LCITEESIVSIKHVFGILFFTTYFIWAIVNAGGAGKQVPKNLFNIGDSIGEGEAAYGTIGATNHDAVWSTGYNLNDIVYSLNERFEDACPTGYYENNATRDTTFNHAVSGSTMDEFAGQANEVVLAAGSTPSGEAGMVAILLGNNDVCASSLEAMTSPEQFERRYRDGLDVFSASETTRNAHILVSSIPALYWLWNAMKENNWCLFIWNFVPCENLLSNPSNDCGRGDSYLDPDIIHDDDGPNCVRRKLFHAKIRDIYNTILRDVLQEYIDDGRLLNAYFVDIFDIQFREIHVDDGDCFHPSVEGHALLADEQWYRSPWGVDAPSCRPHLATPWVPLLLLED
jgi:lysophospholipase L1-like esterase